MNNCNNCGYCGQCQEKKKCANPCSCTEPVFSIEAMPDDPTTLRFNVNGKSVWYDFEPVVKAGETCTAFNVDAVHRLINYHSECGEQTITAKELGSILRLADISDVYANDTGYGILNHRKSGNCGEGCEGIGDGWYSSNPAEIGVDSLDYILGSYTSGELHSLMPPANASGFYYLAWNGADKAKWTSIDTVSVIPTDSDGEHVYSYPVYVDPISGVLVVYKKQEDVNNNEQEDVNNNE